MEIVLSIFFGLVMFIAFLICDSSTSSKGCKGCKGFTPDD